MLNGLKIKSHFIRDTGARISTTNQILDLCDTAVSSKFLPVGISETGEATLLVGSPILVRGETKGEDAATVPRSTWKTDRLKFQN